MAVPVGSSDGLLMRLPVASSFCSTLRFCKLLCRSARMVSVSIRSEMRTARPPCSRAGLRDGHVVDQRIEHAIADLDDARRCFVGVLGFLEVRHLFIDRDAGHRLPLIVD